MAKRRRHNAKLVSRLCSELAEAHRTFHRLKQRWGTLQERRNEVLKEAGANLTGLDYMHVYGYGRALWDTSWNSLDWKLGYEDLNASRHSRTPASAGGWNYSEGPPTHGGHFHPTGELATDWLAFNP